MKHRIGEYATNKAYRKRFEIPPNPEPDQPATIPVPDALAFAEWCSTEILLSRYKDGRWMLIYMDEREREEFKGTAELYEYWLNNIKP